MNICDMIANNAANRPSTIAMIEDERTVTFRDLDGLVRRTANHLRGHGVGEGSTVALSLKDTLDHFVIMLAVFRLGAVGLTLNWSAPAAERERIARMFDADLILVDPRRAMTSGVNCVNVDDTWEQAVAGANTGGDFPHDGTLPMMVATTSGTTGEIKGAVITHDQFFARFVGTWLSYGWVQGDRYFSCTPMTFLVGREYPLFHLIGGNAVVFFPPLFDAREYVEAVARTGATTSFLVPTVLRWLLELPRRDGFLLPTMRVLGLGGALVHEEEKRAAMQRLTPHIADGYGTTGTGIAAVLKAQDMERKANTVGRPTIMIEIGIVDEDGHGVAPGETGVLRCRGPGVASGFYGGGAAEGADETFRDGWYYPGDLAALDDDGFLAIKGRVSDVIIRGGANIVSGEVEAALLSHESVVDAAVVGWPSPSRGEEVAAFVVLNAPVPAGQLIEHCGQRLAAFKIPRQVFVLDALPKGPAGKVRKSELVKTLPPLN